MIIPRCDGRILPGLPGDVNLGGSREAMSAVMPGPSPAWFRLDKDRDIRKVQNKFRA
jgi:hypothetical protein